METVSETRSHAGVMGTAAYRAYQLGRMLCRLPVLKALIPGRLRSVVQRRMLSRGDVIGRLPDRRYMVEVILPALARLEPRRLVDVGVEAYTQHYGRWFPPGCEYWTLDLNPCVARYGAPGRHVVGNALDLASYFEPGSLDVVLLNGPFGFGIDRLDEQERTIEAVRTVLRPGGRMLVGWDRADDGMPVVLQELEPGVPRIKDPLELEGIRAHFAHQPPPGLPARIEFAGCAHIYDWFQAR
jgi:SAM-dependent methyltransferase